MNFKKIIVLGSLLALVGCQDLKGTLSVLKNFKALTKNGTQTILIGTYKTSLDFKRDRVVVALKTNDGETELTIKTPPGTTIPDNGNFEVRSALSGQPFDTLGTNKTVEERSETRRGYESCQYQDIQTVCDPTGCRGVPYTRWGQQYIEYYLRTVTTDLAINLMEIGSVNETLAKFAGHSAFSEKVIVQQTRCF